MTNEGRQLDRRTMLRGGLGLGLGLGSAAVAGCTVGRTAGSSATGGPGTSPGTSDYPTDAALTTTPGPNLSSPSTTTTTSPPTTSPTTGQPQRYVPTVLEPGRRPPQLVVISWDGAGNLPSGEMDRFLGLADEVNASMTLFLSGIYFVPESRRTEYQPPHRPAGSSAIAFLNDTSVRRTINSIADAWRSGHEIGTHFNGHFCGPGGVGSWSSADWRSEVDQAIDFVSNVRAHSNFADLLEMPFDYRKELIGSRTPCLEGRTNLLPVAKDLGWRYDSSGTRIQTWPTRNSFGLWDLSMHSVPFRKGREVLTMDYNFMYLQSGPEGGSGKAPEMTKGNPALFPVLLTFPWVAGW